MTDRIHSLTAVLKEDMREDDVQNIVIAISMISGIIGVEMNVSNPGLWTAEVRAKTELQSKLLELLK